MIAAAIPDETAALTCASIPLSRCVLPLPSAGFMFKNI